MFFWLIMQSSPTSVCWNEQKKRRPITALFQIWKVHFGPWEILHETPVKIRKVSWKEKTLHFLAQTTWLTHMPLHSRLPSQSYWKKLPHRLNLLSGSQLYYKTINCEKNKILPFVQLQHTIASLPHQKNTLMSNWHLIQHLQRQICKNWTFISYILVRGKTLWSHNTHYRACTSCLAGQHFDFNSTDWFSHNLHMSSSWYLWTMGKEFNHLFQ